MVYVTNLGTNTYVWTDELGDAKGTFNPGQSRLVMASDEWGYLKDPVTGNALYPNHNDYLFRQLLVGDTTYSVTYVDFSWVVSVPLIIWALWLTSKMTMRMFARAFGANNANIVD